MATGNDIVTRALTKLGVRASESPLQPDELSDGLDALNDMLSEWEYSGTRLNFSPLSSGAIALNVPDGALGAIKSNLAIRLAPEFGKQVSQALAQEAMQSKEALLISLAHIGDVEFPDTLPKGSGNECEDIYENKYFQANTKDNF